MSFFFFFFFNDTATTEIYTLSLHDALPIFLTFHGHSRAYHHTLEHVHESPLVMVVPLVLLAVGAVFAGWLLNGDRKSTRLNSSHANISYAVFCLKKKNKLSAIVCNNRVIYT